MWNDPTLDIDWPTQLPILSDKDSKGQAFLSAELS
jgi:dTDP-4-dehydrorhamnose 3,5-epimerase-like enzyme